MERDYKFNQKEKIGNKNGVNYCAIKEVFCLDYLSSNLVYCQMHYKNDVNKALLRLGVSLRDKFKRICN